MSSEINKVEKGGETCFKFGVAAASYVRSV